jgi:hypothetical protein
MQGNIDKMLKIVFGLERDGYCIASDGFPVENSVKSVFRIRIHIFLGL